MLVEWPGPAVATHLRRDRHYNDHEIVADNLLHSANRRVSDRITIYGPFTPPLGLLGMTEAEARNAGHDILIGRMPMTQVARAREKDSYNSDSNIVSMPAGSAARQPSSFVIAAVAAQRTPVATRIASGVRSR